MKIISENQIKDLGITPATCVDWAKESFSIKNKAQLPAKISVHRSEERRVGKECRSRWSPYH